MQAFKMKEIEKMIQQELESKILLAHQHALIQNNRTYTEIEFTLDKNGQSTQIETWDTIERLSKDYRSIAIPEHLLKEFVFEKILQYFIIY